MYWFQYILMTLLLFVWIFGTYTELRRGQVPNPYAFGVGLKSQPKVDLRAWTIASEGDNSSPNDRWGTAKWSYAWIIQENTIKKERNQKLLLAQKEMIHNIDTLPCGFFLDNESPGNTFENLSIERNKHD